MEWYWILTIVLGSVLLLFVLSIILYKQFFKRFWDIVLSLLALAVLSWLFIILTVVGAIAMKGNPFFVQKRPGKINKKTGKEKIFSLIKFRTMSNARDKEGNLLPDELRVSKYGGFLRKTSFDELPELFNILIGDMSIVGPRPLLVDYLPYYTDEEKHRHNLRPGLTGLAQVKGRNFLSWEDIFNFDLEYVDKCCLMMDLKILFRTIAKVFKKGEIADVQTITIDENGDSWVDDKGTKKKLHKPLNEERMTDVKRNRQ